MSREMLTKDESTLSDVMKRCEGTGVNIYASAGISLARMVVLLCRSLARGLAFMTMALETKYQSSLSIL